MIEVVPEVYFIAKTQINNEEIERYFLDIGDPKFRPSLEVSDGENLAEIAGRMCYRSWQAYDPNKPNATNPNVSKVREGNEQYLGNVIKQKHGSILEHVHATFIIRNISRICTHEIIRHRAGISPSQESLRYVRLDELSFYMPEIFKENDTARDLIIKTVEHLEEIQKKLAEIYDIDNIKDFHIKKQLTSAFRRVAPEGLATSILLTGNMRAWRHIIEMRTSEAAEEEIRIVTAKIGDVLYNEYPNIFQDMSIDCGEYKFANSKV